MNQRLEIKEAEGRGGIITMPSILSMNHGPILRGTWVLRTILGVRLGEPRGDVPPIKPPPRGKKMTFRERFEAHRENVTCARCHEKIDPIGFGLENFNAAGKWRTEDSYQVRDERAKAVGKRKIWTIDASGAFHKGPSFNDYQELRDLLVEREEDFSRGFTEHLIEYAIGRPFSFADEDLANEMVVSAKSKQFSLSEFVHALIQSEAFRIK